MGRPFRDIRISSGAIPARCAGPPSCTSWNIQRNPSGVSNFRNVAQIASLPGTRLTDWWKKPVWLVPRPRTRSCMARSKSDGSPASRIACLPAPTIAGQSLPLNLGSKYCFSTTAHVLRSIFSRSLLLNSSRIFTSRNSGIAFAEKNKARPIARRYGGTVLIQDIELGLS